MTDNAKDNPIAEIKADRQAPDIYIKNVAIRIHEDYELENLPIRIKNGAGAGEKRFIGREALMAKMKAFLELGKEGVFLVTGYRGMGKTSFVNQVLKEFMAKKAEEKSGKKIVTIDITLTQNNLSEETILRNIVNSLYERENSDKLKEDQVFAKKKKKLQEKILITLILLILPTAVFIQGETLAKYLGSKPPNILLTGVTYLCLLLLFFLVYRLIQLTRLLKGRTDVSGTFALIDSLYHRGYGLLSTERQEQAEFTLEAAYAKLASKPSEKQTYNYPVASVKELEYGLEKYLTKKDNERYIFIFDELDKIELPAVTTSYYEELASFENNKTDSNYLQQLRKRKQTIINTIAGLKGFLTRANATFIFITGREMFDASLADISDRDASISSIFSYVFYVDSFLKESVNQKHNTSLSLTIEYYLSRVLFNCWDKKVDFFFTEIRDRIGRELDTTRDQKYLELNKFIVTVQNFIIYLTYRSNGSPKKLIKAIHEFIKIDENHDIREEVNAGRTIMTGLDYPKSKSNRYLYFKYSDQYRVGFINYLYRPFLIKYGKSLKSYSDSIAASTPYLFDHLLKFHPFAFSLKDLEMIPEVLSTSKTQSLREHISKIVEYLYNSHIREAEIALFEYKFYSRILNEITYISKTFEEESAALNFTLDESYLVKLHVRSKIKELRSIYSRFRGDEKLKKQIFSIYYLNTVLADLHFFDQEYDDAITSYSDAISPAGGYEKGDFSYVDFTSLISCKLKLGLCFEKMGSYLEAHAHYADAAEASKRFISGRLEMTNLLDVNPDENYTPSKERQDDTKEGLKADLVSVNELLLAINQTFLAKLTVEEKKDNHLSTSSLMIAYTDFLGLSQLLKNKSCRNILVHTNFQLVLGNLLFFKNTYKDLDNEDIDKYRKDYAEAIAFQNCWTHLNGQDPENERRKPTAAFAMYIGGLEEILGLSLGSILDSTENSDKGLATAILNAANWKKVLAKPEFTNNHFRYVAILLSNIGNCILSMAETRPKQKELGIIKWSEFWQRDTFEESRKASAKDPSAVFSIDSGFLTSIKAPPVTPNAAGRLGIADVLCCYYLSALFFYKSARATTSCYQLKKILFVMRMVLANPSDKAATAEDALAAKSFIDFVWSTLMVPILDINSKITEHSDSHMINKFDRILNPDTYKNAISLEADGYLEKGLLKSSYPPDFNVRRSENLLYIQDNISNHPETREASMLYYYICLKVLNNPGSIPTIITPQHSIASQFTRLLELDLCQKISWAKLSAAKFPGAAAINDKVFNQLQANYLYSLVTIVSTLTVYGISYTISYNYLAYAHLRIAKWLTDMRADHRREEIIAHVKEYCNDSNSAVLHDAKVHFRKAKVNYEKAIQLHTAGLQFRNAIKNLVYLEDDINDNAFHFGAAMERWLYNNGILENCIQQCEEGELADLQILKV